MLKGERRMYVHLYFNSGRAVEDEKELNSRLSTLQEEIESGKRSFTRRWVSRHQPRYSSFGNAGSMVSHSENLVRDTLLFGLLFSTGCRISEILNINVSELDLTNEMMLLIKTKTKVQRVVVLREGFGEILREYLSKYRSGDSIFLFPGREPDQPMLRNDVNLLFQEFLIKANLPNMHIHSSRHSFATFMRDEGVDLFTIMELLGHEKFQSTLHYTRHYTRNKNIKIKQHDDVYDHLRGVLKNLDK
jgi:integrase